MTWKNFTRGEKCLIVHISLTLLLISIIVALGLVHFLTTSHKPKSVKSLTNNENKLSWQAASPYKFTAAVLLATPAPKPVCNAVIVHELWSLSSGHCVAIRNDPDLSLYLPEWRIIVGSLRITDGGLLIPIKSGLAHPHFDRDDFQNNIGLFQHKKALTFSATISKVAIGSANTNDYEETAVVGWALKSKDSGEYNPLALLDPVLILPQDTCKRLMSPVLPLREHELCAVARSEVENCHPASGAALVNQGELIGLASWGDKCSSREMPVIFTRIRRYVEWINEVIDNKTSTDVEFPY